MKIVCVEPIINSGELTSFVVFEEDGRFLYHQFCRPDNADHYLNLSRNSINICYDVFKTLPMFGDALGLIWDVRILYEFLGHKFRNLIMLGKDVFPSEKVVKYFRLSEQIKAHLNSYKQCNIDITGYEAVQLLPEDLVRDLYLERSKLIISLFLNLSEMQKEFYEKFYPQILSLHRLSQRPLNVNLNVFSGELNHFAIAARENTKDGKTCLKYNAVGAKTGRITFRKSSLNLYNLPKTKRGCIIASEKRDIVEIDFKSFQPRIAIFSTDSEAFKEEFRNIDDIYSIFPGDREKNKIGFLAWMYAKTRIPNCDFEKYAFPVWELREKLAKQCRDEGFLKTKYGRYLYTKEEPNHVIFQNFITATEVDCVLNLVTELLKQGFDVLLPYHDAIICEVDKGDQESLRKMKKICEDFLFSTFQARFPVVIKIGDTFGALNEVQIV